MQPNEQKHPAGVSGKFWMCTSKLSSYHIRNSADYVLLISLIFFPSLFPGSAKCYSLWFILPQSSCQSHSMEPQWELRNLIPKPQLWSRTEQQCPFVWLRSPAVTATLPWHCDVSLIPSASSASHEFHTGKFQALTLTNSSWDFQRIRDRSPIPSHSNRKPLRFGLFSF